MTASASTRRRFPPFADHVWAALGVALVAAAARLAVLPFATTDGGDAPSRVWKAWTWMSDPGPITYGVWGPLHTYLIALSLALVPDPVHAPIALSIGLSVAGAVAMYAFVRVEFESARGALLAALSYAVYPIAIRNGVSVRSEAPFALFLLLAMIGVALARREEGSWRHAAAGGLALTLASMLRYEGWMLTPLLAVLLWRKPKLLLTFCAFAAIHPLVWMVGNGLHYGDPLYSMTWASRWELDAMGRAGIDQARLARQAASYPLTLVRGMTLPLGLICAAGAGLAAATRHRSRVWLIPLGGLLAFWAMAIARGSLVPKLNYTQTAGTLLFPFSALVYQRLGVRRWAAPVFAIVALGLVATGVIFSCWSCLARVGLGRLDGISPIPRIENQEVALDLPPILVESMGGAHAALISDHYGWGAPLHVALLTRLHPSRIFLAPGAPNRQPNLGRLSWFLTRHPRGVLVALSGSRLSRALGITPAATSVTCDGTELRLEKVRSVPWPGKQEAELTVFRYMTVP
ncbi:MAG TPA: glycosyltransferase family 39 protein [Gemmatimonadales bacterium]|nr:glycosyltransferase family 39 protein [Gemmatimonadales bacterium]